MGATRAGHMNIRPSDEGIGFIAYDDGGAKLGCIHVSPQGVIQQLEVLPEFRRQGIGSALLRAVLDVLPPQTDLWVEPVRSRVDPGGGEAFFTAHGFTYTRRMWRFV